MYKFRLIGNEDKEYEMHVVQRVALTKFDIWGLSTKFDPSPGFNGSKNLELLRLPLEGGYLIVVTRVRIRQYFPN